MPTNTYDVIVLGDDLGGLVAGALCARRGLRVLVAETASTPLDRIPVGRHNLPRTAFPFVGESSPAVRRVVAELNFIQTLKRRLAPLRPSFQLVLPDARLDVGPDNEPMIRELARELPDERAAIEAFLARAADVSRVLEPVLGQDVSLPPDGFWERREMARYDARLPGAGEDLLAGLPSDSRARALAALPAALTLPLDPRALSPVAAARAFDLWRRGVSRLDGGRDTLRAMLIEKLRTQHAGELRTVDPAGIVTRWGKASGLSLRDRGETVGMGHLVHSGAVAELGDLFGEKRPKRVAQLARGVRPTAYRYVLNLVVAEAGIPEGIAPVVFAAFDAGKPLIGDNAIALSIGEPDDQAQVLVTVVANAPAPEDGQTLDDVLAALRPKILARVEEVMPFSADHILVVHSPNQARVDGIDAKVPVYAPEPLWTPEEDAPLILGVGAVPYDVGVKGVTPAGSQVLPGLGLEGEMTAGWCAARLVCAAAGKKKDYLKDERLLGT